jgi:hypothetical protein
MEHNAKLVSSEVAALWGAYMQNTLHKMLIGKRCGIEVCNGST